MAKSRSDDVQRVFDDAEELVFEQDARRLGRSRIRSGQERLAAAKQTAATRVEGGRRRQAAVKKTVRKRGKSS